MKIILVIVTKKIVQVFYWFGKLRSDNKFDVLVVGNQDYLTDDQKLLLKRLGSENLSTVFLFNVEKNNLLLKLFAYMKCAFLVAKAKNIIVFDYCFPLYCVKKSPWQRIFQLWHANGAFKMFGMPSFVQKHGEKLAKKLYDIVQIHSNYDYIFVSNEECIPFYMEAFNDYKKEKYLVSNNMYLDLFVEKYEESPHSKSEGVINILLAKTYNFQSEENIYSEFIEIINEQAKMHGLIVNISTLLHPKLAYNQDKFKLLSNCYIVVTDYSTICFEASAIGKSVAFLRGSDKIDLFVEVAKKIYYEPKELAMDILEGKVIDNKLNEHLSIGGDRQLDIVIDLIKQNL